MATPAVPYAQAPGTISSGTINQLPDWYTNYGKTVSSIGQGMAQGLTGYNGYTDANGNPIPTVAGLTPTQQAGIDATKANVGSWKQGFGTAGDTASGGVSAINGATSTYDAAKNGIGGATGNYNLADSTIGSASNPLSGAGNTITGALGTINTGVGQIGQASGALSNMGGALGKASSYLDPAAAYTATGASGSQFDPSNLARYANPYTTGVNNEIARLGNENLTENVLPGVNSTFTGAGQFGSTRNADFTNRAIRDNQREITGAQSKVLMDAQGQALNQADMQANRDLQAGQQLGGLSSVAQGVASGFGNQAGQQINQGQGTIQAGGTQLGAAGQQINQGQAIIGQGQALASVGNDRVGQGQALTSVGNSQVGQGQALGGLSQLQAGQAQAASQLGSTDAQGLLATGGLQQATDQKALDAAHADFVDRRDYPVQTLGALSNILPGISGKITPNQQTVQVNATQATDPYQAVSNVLSGLGVSNTP